MEDCPPKSGSVTLTIRPPGRTPFRAVSLDDLTAVVRIYRKHMAINRDELKKKRLQAMGVVGSQMDASSAMYDRVIEAAGAVAVARDAAETAHMGALSEQIADLNEMAEDMAEFAQAVPTSGGSSGTKLSAATAAPATITGKLSAGFAALAALNAAQPNPETKARTDEGPNAYKGTSPPKL